MSSLSAGSNFVLTVGGDSFPLRSVSVETRLKEVAVQVSRRIDSGRTVSSIKSEASFSGSADMLTGGDIRRWIAKYIKGFGTTSQNLVFSGLNAKQQVEAETEFLNALITEIKFPALDAASKDELLFDLQVKGQAKSKKGDGRKISVQRSETGKQWLASNFRIEIGSLPCESITKIDAITIKQTVASNLVVTGLMQDQQPFQDWFEEVLTKGKHRHETGTLFYLEPTGRDSPLSLVFAGLSPMSIRNSRVGKGLATFECTLGVSSVSLDYSRPD